LFSAAKITAAAIINTVVFLQTDLKTKIHIFTAPVALGTLTALAEILTAIKNRSITKADVLKLGLLATQTTGVLLAIYSGGEGNVFDRNAAGEKPLLMEAIGCGLAASSMLASAAITMFKEPASKLGNKLYSCFFSRQRNRSQSLLAEEEPSDLTTVNVQTSGLTPS
jgi:hypothetical protein